jgi:hypothetical protein
MYRILSNKKGPPRYFAGIVTLKVSFFTLTFGGQYRLGGPFLKDKKV